MADCEACRQAAHRPDRALFHARCHGCQVRQFAQGLLYWQSEQAGRLEPAYRHALERSFGEGWQKAHAEIKAESGRIRALRDMETLL